MVQLASKVVGAKKRKEDSISLNDVYDLSVDALTGSEGRLLLHTSRCVTSHSQLLRCCLAMSCLRVFTTSRKLSEWRLKV